MRSAIVSVVGLSIMHCKAGPSRALTWTTRRCPTVEKPWFTEGKGVPG
jgi:hypothetical protein